MKVATSVSIVAVAVLATSTSTVEATQTARKQKGVAKKAVAGLALGASASGVGGFTPPTGAAVNNHANDGAVGVVPAGSTQFLHADNKAPRVGAINMLRLPWQRRNKKEEPLFAEGEPDSVPLPLEAEEADDDDAPALLTEEEITAITPAAPNGFLMPNPKGRASLTLNTFDVMQDSAQKIRAWW